MFYIERNDSFCAYVHVERRICILYGAAMVYFFLHRLFPRYGRMGLSKKLGYKKMERTVSIWPIKIRMVGCSAISFCAK